jgi:deoxyribose-phosphate aldolase
MYIDFAFINTDTNDVDAKNIVTEIIQYPINSITAPYYLIKAIKNLIPTDRISLSCLIDYPLGVSDSKTRRFSVEQAAKLGVNFVDIAMPQNLAANRRYDKIRDDIKYTMEFCSTNNLQPRYILEYRTFDHHCLKKICEIFESFKITYVFPSTGFFLDNLADNILASVFLYQNSKDLNVISTGNVWADKHFDTIIKSGLFGFRTTSIHSLKNFTLFNSGLKDK